jgi:hypothetical protein
MITEKIDAVLKAGKPYLKHLRYVSDDCFKIQRRQKGCHKLNTVLNEIKRRKIICIANKCKAEGAIDFVQSKMTNSIYFSINSISVRVSDHPKTSFPGVSIIIQWDTDMSTIII